MSDEPKVVRGYVATYERKNHLPLVVWEDGDERDHPVVVCPAEHYDRLVALVKAYRISREAVREAINAEMREENEYADPPAKWERDTTVNGVLRSLLASLGLEEET